MDEEAKLYADAHPMGEKRLGTFHGVMYRYHTHTVCKHGRISKTAAAMRVGDVCFTFLPGEIFLRFGDALRQSVGGPLINSSCCTDYNVGCVVPPDCFSEGGCEAGASNLSPEAYEGLLTTARELLDEVRYS